MCIAAVVNRVRRFGTHSKKGRPRGQTEAFLAHRGGSFWKSTTAAPRVEQEKSAKYSRVSSVNL